MSEQATPSGWRTDSLGNVCRLGGGSIQTGPFGSQLHAEDYKEDGVPIITVEHLKERNIAHENLPLVGGADYQRLIRYKLSTGDLVFSRVGAIDRCAYVSDAEDGWLFSGRCLRVRAGRGQAAPEFLSYLLNSWQQRQWILNYSVGSTMACLNTAILSRVPVTLPPLLEQRKIAQILTTVDNLIGTTEALIAKYQSVKEGLMQDLFTRGVDEHGHLRPAYAEAPDLYKESELGWIPREWAMESLEKVSSSLITYGIVQPGPHILGGVPFVQTKDLTGGSLNRAQMDCTSEEIADSYTRSAVQAGDIVCGIRATVGVILEIPPALNGANISRGVARISPKAAYNSRYILWAMRSRRMQDALQREVKGTTYAEVTLPALRRIRIPVPQRNEQDYMVGAIQAAEARINSEWNILSKYHIVKTALMQDLLTGKVRVKVDEATDV